MYIRKQVWNTKSDMPLQIRLVNLLALLCNCTSTCYTLKCEHCPPRDLKRLQVTYNAASHNPAHGRSKRRQHVGPAQMEQTSGGYCVMVYDTAIVVSTVFSLRWNKRLVDTVGLFEVLSIRTYYIKHNKAVFIY